MATGPRRQYFWIKFNPSGHVSWMKWLLVLEGNTFLLLLLKENDEDLQNHDMYALMKGCILINWSGVNGLTYRSHFCISLTQFGPNLQCPSISIWRLIFLNITVFCSSSNTIWPRSTIFGLNKHNRQSSYNKIINVFYLLFQGHLISAFLL